MSSRERVSDQTGLRRNIRPVLISVLAGAVVCVILLVLFAFVLSAQNIPQALVSPMATVAVSIGGLASGYICAKMMRENGLVYGLLCGGLLAVLLLLGSFGIGDNGLGVPALFKIIFILLCGMLGGVLGVNTRKRRRVPKR